jgi:LacI family transcriptional regulator
MKTNVTMKDVAELADVSTTTVSHVVNNTRYVSELTREKVEDAMQTLGYRPNYLARSLRSGETKTIGLLVPDASNPYFAEIARQIEDLGYGKGYSVILGNSDNNSYKQANYINTFIAKKVDGVILISTGSKTSELQPLIDNDIPIVLADRDVSRPCADVVLLDNVRAAYEATRYLIELGHECIACITGQKDLFASTQRVKGYKKALTEFNIPIRDNLIEMGDFRFEGGELAMQRLLEKSCSPTAVLALNDLMAIGAMKAIMGAGLSVPNDISVIGFDDIQFASAVKPALTTMAQPQKDFSHFTVDTLIQRMAGEIQGEHQRIILPAKLVVRESTKRNMKQS